MKIIKEHDHCCKLTMDLNSWYKYLVLIYYYLIVPTIDFMLVYLIKEKNPLFRFPSLVVILVIVSNIFIVHFFLTSISRSAHSSYVHINSLIATYNFSRKVKFKSLNLIERLSGPVIGVYCYDFFPFTNFEFYMFINNCVLNFILFIGLAAN